MNYSQFDRYAFYLKGAALLIALLTYWRFRDIDLSAVYAYVAQGDVVHSILFQSAATTRSVVWDFFGLIDRQIMPHSVRLLRYAGLILTVLDLYILSTLLDFMLGQKFWGFLGVFLAALSPFAVLAAISGGPGAAAAALVLLFLLALYRNQYVFAGLLAGVCFAANLPGLIMFLITILDMLQNLLDRKKIVTKLLTTVAAFLAVMALVYFYSVYSGNPRVFSLPLAERDINWTLNGVIPLLVVNVLNLAGVVYLVLHRRYDVYRTHFHTLMLWVAACALCIAQPSTVNLLVALVVSTVLSMFFLQGFNSLWQFKLVSGDTFVFVFVILFLFGDLYANNSFLGDVALQNSFQKDQTVGEVVTAVSAHPDAVRLVSNFVPAELSVKLGRQVYDVGAGVLPFGGVTESAGPVIYVAKRDSRVDRVSTGCRILLNTSLIENKKAYPIMVVECGKSK